MSIFDKVRKVIHEITADKPKEVITHHKLKESGKIHYERYSGWAGRYYTPRDEIIPNSKIEESYIKGFIDAFYYNAYEKERLYDNGEIHMLSGEIVACVGSTGYLEEVRSSSKLTRLFNKLTPSQAYVLGRSHIDYLYNRASARSMQHYHASLQYALNRELRDCIIDE